MRASFLIVPLLFLASVPSASAASITMQDAVSAVKSAGYSLVSKAEEAQGAWDVWASKDGIAYEVKVDANDGALLRATPVEDND